MFIRRLLHLPLLGALLLCLLASPGGALGFIWCIGADGHSHAKLQTGLPEDCCDPRPAAPADEHDDHGLSAAAQAHDDCLHIAITGQIGTAPGRDHLALDDAPATTGASAATSFTPQICHDVTTGLFTEHPPRIADPILQHRTIVLLI